MNKTQIATAAALTALLVGVPVGIAALVILASETEKKETPLYDEDYPDAEFLFI